jgi:dipeptidyl aminopeptidase/acylaminoacyl peptidase
MTDDRSLERAARSWLEAGPIEAPDRAVESALLRIQTTPQERDLRIPWRLPTMTTSARVATAAVIGVLAVGGAFLFFGRPGQPALGGPGPSQSATPEGSATTAPKASASRALDYTGLPGWIVFEHFGQAPDGSTTQQDMNRRQIWLIHADGTGLHELAPGVPPEGKTAPDISPDGTKVAFSVWDHKVQLWEVGIDGTNPHVLASVCSGDPNVCLEGEPAYSPDGTRLAFVREVAGTPRQNVIGIRDLATGKVTLLEQTRTPVTTGFHTQPSWSPDGHQIIFSLVSTDPKTDEALDSRIFLVNTDGTGLHDMGLPAGTPWGDPDWSPDGSRIVFSSWPIGNFNKDTVSVYTARPDGSDVKMLTDISCGGCGAPSWTPDGAHILFWGPTTFWLMDPDGQNQAPINEPKLTFYGPTLGYGYYGSLQPTP